MDGLNDFHERLQQRRRVFMILIIASWFLTTVFLGSVEQAALSSEQKIIVRQTEAIVETTLNNTSIDIVLFGSSFKAPAS